MSNLRLQVAVDTPFRDKLTYNSADDFQVYRGDTVEVPLGTRKVKGVVVEVLHVPMQQHEPAQQIATNHSAQIQNKSTEIEIKKILALDSEWPRLEENFLCWLEWIADYYIHPLGQVIKLCFPPLRKAVKARASKRPSVIPNSYSEQFTANEKNHSEKRSLTEEQSQCLAAIDKAAKGFAVHLVHGVTGSGKTEIYLQLFAKTLNEKKRGIFLVPEIALTPQLIQRFAERFGDRIAVLHSQLTDRERTTQWWDIVEGKKDILIGARSALFCPIANLGLIVVDEEHEASYKQDEKLRYNGRDCAVMLAKFSNCPVILGSATPSLDTWKNAVDGRYHLHQLKSRVQNRPMPSIEVIDMRLEKDLEKKSLLKPHWLSQKLYEEIQESLSKEQQVALLLNRRGMAHMLFCQSCGYSMDCPNCDISLTLHAHTHLVCHYCDYHENAKTKCPDCKEGELITMGLGTEKVEEDLRRLFPQNSIARADRDEVQSRLQMEDLVQRMEKKEIDILIGTQMIAKGLDFTHLKLVGLLLADVSFNLPDFRATEKSFQLITQMSGRSGRHIELNDQPGKVVIQTYNTQHDSICYSQQHDYEGFVGIELQHRQQLNYPPYHKIAAVRVQSMDLEKARQTASQVAHRAQLLKDKFAGFGVVDVLGPAAAPIAKLRNQYRYHLLFKCPQPKVLNQFLRKILGDSKWVTSKVKITVDVDPQNLL